MSDGWSTFNKSSNVGAKSPKRPVSRNVTSSLVTITGTGFSMSSHRLIIIS